MMSGLWECMARNNPQAPKSVFCPDIMIQNRKGDLLMILADTLRLLITITVCCCITGLLMWLFLL